MATFRITWLDGSTEIVTQSDRDTVEGYIACRFGASYDPKVKVELVEFETKVYSDGTEATGVAPLPVESPVKKTRKGGK